MIYEKKNQKLNFECSKCKAKVKGNKHVGVALVKVPKGHDIWNMTYLRSFEGEKECYVVNEPKG